MKATLIKTAKFLDVRNLHQYMEEARAYQRFAILESARFSYELAARETLPLDRPGDMRPDFPWWEDTSPVIPQYHLDRPASLQEVRSMVDLDFEELAKTDSGYRMGAVLYPYVMRKLEPLGIMWVDNLYDTHTGERLARGRLSYHELGVQMALYANAWPQFDARVNGLDIGSNMARMEFHYSSSDSDVKVYDPAIDMTHLPLDEPGNRAVSLAVRMSRSRGGIERLEDLFGDAIFEESLVAFGRPLPTIRSQIKAMEYEDEGFDEDSDLEYDDDVSEALYKRAHIAQLRYLEPLLARSKIHLERVFIEMDEEGFPQYADVRSMDELIGIIADPTFRSQSVSPDITATFREREIALEIEPEHDLYAVQRSGMQVYDKEEPGVLPELLNAIRAL